MGPIRCPETSVKDYHSALLYSPEERRSHLEQQFVVVVVVVVVVAAAAVVTLPQQNENIRATQEGITVWKSKPLYRRHVWDVFKNPEVDKTTSNAWLKAGELFPETTGFVIAIQDEVIRNSSG
jgi:hypothetical protein